MYKKALLAVGLTDKQAEVYLSCITHGAAKVPEIARRTELKRTTVYGIVDELVAMSLLLENYKGKTKEYTAQNPEELIHIMEEKSQLVAAQVSGLSDLFFTQHSNPKITSFAGREGLRKIYEDALKCKAKEIRQVVNVKDHVTVVGDAFIKDYIKRRVANGITAYDLHPKSGSIYTETRGTKNKDLKRKVRYLPPQIFHAAMIMIYDHKVAMISTKDENFGFLIESKEFANTIAAYFDFMWSIGSKTPDID